MERRMVVPQGRQPIGLIAARVLLVAHADEGVVEQPHDECRYALLVESVTREVGSNGGPEMTEHGAERRQLVELLTLAMAPERRVVAVLLATPSVPSSCLKVAGGVSSNPH